MIFVYLDLKKLVKMEIDGNFFSLTELFIFFLDLHETAKVLSKSLVYWRENLAL
jgi:hypothetical protein